MLKKLMIIAFIVQLIVVTAVVLYFGGIRKYGTPAQYKAKMAEKIKTQTDSLRLAEMELVPSGNIADSTMYDLGNHIKLFEKTERYENEIRALQTALDSLKREKAALEKMEVIISQKENLLKTVQEQSKNSNMIGLAKMFDAMKPQQAIPVIREINDTLAVNILSRMQSRNSAKLLGALAEVDTTKAVRLSKLLARTGILDGK